MSEFFKKLKLHELLQVQINSKLNEKNCMSKSWKIFLEVIFHNRENLQSFCTKFLLSFYLISLAQKNSYCLSANHIPVL